MPYFLFGVTALVLGLMALSGLSRADVAVLARRLRHSLAIVALGSAAVLVFRGALAAALPLAMIGAWMLWGHAPSAAGGWGGRQAGAGRRSRIETAHLEMELDHDTGEMRGRIIAGRHAGSEIQSLPPAELAQLWHDYSFADPRSAQLVEAYLDQTRPDWREAWAHRQGAADQERATASDSSAMSVAEALQTLGLPPDASDDDIRRAHRELMLKLHPDRGGSDYLAARINAAKDILLHRK